MCKVSIVIPVYENPIALERLMSSIAIQSYTDFKIYITDDSVSDKDRDVVSKWMKDKRLEGKIDYEKNSVSKGASENTYYVMEKADGEYIKIMHHDDCFSCSESLGKMVSLLDNNVNADFAFAGTYEVFYDEQGQEIGNMRQAKSLPELERLMLNESPFALFVGNFVEGPSTTIVRNKGHKYDQSLKWLVDIDYYMNILKDNPVYAFSTENLVCMGHLSTQVTQECVSDFELIFRETKYEFMKYGLVNNSLYRKYMIRNAITTGHTYKDIKETKISLWEYLNHKIRITVRKVMRKS